MASSFTKFNCFVEDLAHQVHNLKCDNLKAFLTNQRPSVEFKNKSQIDEILSGNGYVLGGNDCAVLNSSQKEGAYKLSLVNPKEWVADDGNIGPFRYIVLYNNSTQQKNLIGFWDYETSITLTSGETFQVLLDESNGVLQLF